MVDRCHLLHSASATNLERMIPVGSTPEELATLLKSEMDKWGPVIKAANIKVSD
jgi:tripartite-type tricarboxylate transporter receptor subunit TctC